MEIPMSYGKYLENFPQGHKRRNIKKSDSGFLVKDKDNLHWITLKEYNNQGRKLYGKHWVNFEDR